MGISLNNVDQGLDFNDRIGNKIHLERVTFNFNLVGLDTDSCDVMVAMVKSKYNPGANTMATAADFDGIKYTTTASQQGIYTATGRADALLPWNTNEFYVYYQEIFTLDSAPADSNTTLSVIRSIDCTRMFKRNQTFGTPTGNCNEIVSVMFIPLNTVTTFPSMAYSYTFEFTDS